MTIVEYLSRPEILRRMEPFVRPEILRWTEPFVGFIMQIGRVIEHLQEQPASPGYEPFLVRRGIAPVGARGMAALAVRNGTRTENDSLRLLPVVSAIRFLAEPRRSGRAIALRADVLLAAWAETSVLETIFDAARLNVFEFVDVLKLAADGDDCAQQRLTEICAALAPLSVRRGPKVSAASVAHEFLLENILEGACAYSWSQLEDRCVDHATEATRREFRVRRFDSRPACRRLKSRRGAGTS